MKIEKDNLKCENCEKENKTRMSFVDFNCLFMEYSKNLTSHSDISIYAPIIYNMKDEYFDALIRFRLFDLANLTKSPRDSCITFT